MTSSPFQGHSSIQELLCTGKTLPSDVDVLVMVMYLARTNAIIAYVNTRKRECFTSSDFVSCSVDETVTRNSELKVLIVDFVGEDSRKYGCNVSTVAAGGRLQVVSWYLPIHYLSKFSPLFCVVLWLKLFLISQSRLDVYVQL